MFKQFITVFYLCFCTITMFGQEDWTIFKKREKVPVDTVELDSVNIVKHLDFNTPDGTITINQNSKIDSLTSKISNAPFINGYTVQIEVSQQKSVIRESRYRFLKEFPDVPLDDKYNAPNTYLYGGRFYDRNSAYEFKHKVRNYFPDAIVIQMKMDLPPLGPN